MQIPKRIILWTCAVVVVFVALPVGAQTQPQEALSDEHKARIVANCTSVKASLQQLHRSDASLRVNRGQLYESIATKLMARLNSRIAMNRLDGGDLVAATAKYEQALAAFRRDYRTYEISLSDVLRIDCSKEPSRFYYAVLDTRAKRSIVGQRVQQLHDQIDTYGDEFEEFVEQYNTSLEADHE